MSADAEEEFVALCSKVLGFLRRHRRAVFTTWEIAFLLGISQESAHAAAVQLLTQWDPDLNVGGPGF